jgi:hypothetical protein
MENNSEYFNTDTFSDDESSNMSSSKSSLFKSNPTSFNSFNSFNLILNNENNDDDDNNIFNTDYYKDYKDPDKYMFIKENLQAKITSIDKENQTINIIIDDKLEFDKINIINKPLSIQSICTYKKIINPIMPFQKLKIYDNILVETKWKIHKLSNEGHCVPLIY